MWDTAEVVNKAVYLPYKLQEFELHLERQRKYLWKYVKGYIWENKL